MCGRFTVTAKDTKKIADRFQVELEKALERNSAGEAPPPSKERVEEGRAGGLGRFNVAPTQEILTVRSSPDPDEAAQGEREARLMRWGLVPRWAKDLKVGYRMINAKAENLTSSRAYSPLVGKFRHRCLIVADGFYEWMKAEDPEAAAPALALHRRRRRAVRLRRPLHPQGVGGRRGPRFRRRLALQLHDRHHDPERAWSPRSTTGCRRSCPAPRPRRPGCGRTSSRRTRSRCAGRSTADRMDGAPANPKLNKVGKGTEEGPELLVAPLSRLSSAFLRLRLLLRPVLVFFFGFFVDRRRHLFSTSSVRTVALPAPVVSVQETLTPGILVVRQIVSKGSTQVLLRLAVAGGTIASARCRSCISAIRA